MKTQTRSTRVKAPTNQSQVINVTPGNEDDEVIAPKPSGRDMTDNSDKQGKDPKRKTQKTKEKMTRKVINQKKPSYVATYNVRTIREEFKQLELIKIFSESNTQILGIIDHKIVHEDEEINYKTLQGYTLITQSAWRNEQNAACGGVGILLYKRAENALAEVKCYNERILIAKFNGNPAVTIIVNYSPQEGTEEAKEHYANLINAINDTPKHDILMVMGDFNAHIGKEDAKFSYHETTNKNGQLLLDLALECNMVILNTKFQKKKGKLWTYLSDMTGHMTQVDYILINKKWSNSVKDIEACNTYSSMGSDHRALRAKVKISLRTCEAPQQSIKYDWSALRSDKSLQELFSVTVENGYAELYDEAQNATEKYENLIQSNEEAAEKLIPKRKKKRKKKTSDDPRIVETRQKVQEAFAKYQKDPTTNNQIELQAQKQSLQTMYDQCMEEELEEQIRKVESLATEYKHRESWKIVNEISGRNKSKKGILEGKNKEERIKNWFNHFKQLLGEEPKIDNENEEINTVIEGLQYQTGPFSISELEKAKSKIGEGKAAGPDKIPPEVIKRCDLDDIILSFANRLLTEGEKPNQWSLSDIIPIAKKGNLRKGENYRGISLNAIIAKLTNRLILNRIQPVLDPHLRPNQNGFRPGRSTTSQILALRRLIEGVKANNLPAAILFLDFRKAFDSIHRGKMLKILKAYGIPDELVKAIAKMYENTRARVLSPDGETDWFDIIAGVLQGDTLAPYLFTIVLDYAMREALQSNDHPPGFTIEQRRSRRYPPVTISDLDFADDIALTVDKIEEAQNLLVRVEEAAAKVGLHLNAKKTEAIIYNQHAEEIRTNNNEEIKVSKDFKYLGAWIDDSVKDMKTRKAQAWVACNKLNKVWKSNLHKNLKIRLFQATVESVFLYGSETWTVTKSTEKSIDGAYTRMLRSALNVSWRDHVTNEELYGHLPKLSSKIRTRRMRIAGHCVRHNEEEASKLILWQPQHGKRKRGKPKTTYVDTLLEDTGLATTGEIRTAMMDKADWRGRIHMVRAGARPK